MGISNREKEIIGLISSGYTSREIGNHLAISKETVKSHKHSLFKKVQAKNAANLVYIVLSQGVLDY